MSKKGVIDAILTAVFGFTFIVILGYSMILFDLPDDYTTFSLLGLGIYPLFRRYNKRGWHSIRVDMLNILVKVKDFTQAIIYLGVLLVVCGIIIWGGYKIFSKIWDIITPDTWTLIVCDTKLNYAECLDNSYVIPGFTSKKECLLEGASRFSKEGFECGRNCDKTKSLNLNICEEICNKAGCN